MFNLLNINFCRFQKWCRIVHNVCFSNEKMCNQKEIFGDQATKGARWMPWQYQAMKDVISCDKRWSGANFL